MHGIYDWDLSLSYGRISVVCELGASCKIKGIEGARNSDLCKIS